MQTRNKSRSRHHCQPALYRRGSTLLIVVALMGMLAFLGFAFYTLAVQERANALSFAQEAKVTKAPSLEPDALFDFALQQVIIGPDDAYTQSILWGGRHSLMANMYGRDRVPFNGEGVNLMQTAAGQPQVDMNFDGSSTGENVNLLNFVDSAVANGGTKWGSNTIYLSGARTPATDLPDPDVNYNSSDINSLYMSYDGNAVNAAGATSRVLIPSFFRPQYLRLSGAHRTDWYSVAATANQVMRPHPNHICVNSSGAAITVGGTNVTRFVNSTDYQSLGLRRPFTFAAPAAPSYYAPVGASGSASSPYGRLGVWSGHGQNEIDLDVDTDGDGILDAILMDLGYPPIRRGDGKLVVPLFAISIRDLNGLLNVNATGNLSGNLNLGSLTATSPSGGWLGYRRTGASNYVPDSLSKSNQGLSPYEINILRALTADPTASTDLLWNSETAYQLSYFLQQFDTNINTSSAVKPGRSVSELANLEWLLLNIGRAQFHLGLATSATPLQDAITDMFSGRNGEPTRLRNFLTTANYRDMPTPGLSVSWSGGLPTNWNPPPAVNNPEPDDNFNAKEGEYITATRWVHPLDFRGSGQQYKRYDYGPDGQPGQATVDDDGNGVVDDFTEEGWVMSDDIAAPYGPYGKAPELYRNGANLWPAYSGYHSFGTVRWGENQGATSYHDKLMRGSRADSLLDDPAEAIIDPTLMSPSYSGYTFLSNARDNDMVFGPEEMPFLQGSESDGRLSDAQSRLAELMPANLVASSNAADIRKRLTTVSSDRREYGYGTSSVGGLRRWEVDRDNNPATGPDYFPPTGPVIASPQNYTDPTLSPSPSNPYRAELFDLLKQVGNAGKKHAQFRLNVVRYLTNNGFAIANPNYQIGSAALPQQPAPPAPLDPANWKENPLTATERQAMARDIYTLLYTLCLGQDTDYRTATLLGLPAQSKGVGKAKGRKKKVAKVAVGQAQEMAQFAVNLVDALDPDDIPTAFYYDPDLQTSTGGWSGAPAADGKFYVVYGVERQSLAFSEALAIRVNRQSTDSPMTIFDDKTVPDPADGLRYLFCELQNVTPMNVTLASGTSTNKSSANWRVTLEGVNGANTDYLNSVYFLSGLDAANNQIQIDASGNRYLAPGSVFTVSSQDGTDKFTVGSKYRTSDFRANRSASPTTTGPFDRIAPSGGQPDTAGGRIVPSDSTPDTQFPTPKCNLDLVWDYGGAAKFELETNNGTKGAFVTGIDATYSSIQLVLERRATDGNWIEVDRTKDINVQAVDPPTAPPAVTDLIVNPILDIIKSSARTTPLNRSSEVPPTPPTPHVYNTLNTAGTSSSTTAWQWHLDRDFASLGELMQLPLYGPDDLTNGQITDSEFVAGKDSSNNPIYIPTVAAGRFLRPDLTDIDTCPLGNRWYRLLEFLEVPNRSHQHTAIRTQSALTTPVPTMLAEPYNLPIGFGWPRTHGQLNLNMIRHPQALAALLDDDLLINGATPMLNATDAPETTTRQWWVQFLKARDSRSTGNFAVDPVTSLYVPGTGNSRPFRGFDAVGRLATSTTDGPLENTILRSLPLDGTPGGNPDESRRLFEVGTGTGASPEHQKTVADEADATKSHLHPAARYRLLSKLLNNVTTRSNSFGVFVTVQYYEAAQVEGLVAGVPTTATRIGGRLDDTPTHRGYFVVDRTGAIEQMKVLTANPVSSNSFSFKANTNQTGTPNGIRWKDLILFRKTLN